MLQETGQSRLHKRLQEQLPQDVRTWFAAARAPSVSGRATASACPQSPWNAGRRHCCGASAFVSAIHNSRVNRGACCVFAGLHSTRGADQLQCEEHVVLVGPGCAVEMQSLRNRPCFDTHISESSEVQPTCWPDQDQLCMHSQLPIRQRLTINLLPERRLRPAECRRGSPLARRP